MRRTRSHGNTAATQLCACTAAYRVIVTRLQALTGSTKLCVGHSLGGAMATVAAYDIRTSLLAQVADSHEVVCYTFAAPRTGNHAFAREYNAMVPDTWSVINDQVSH